MTGNYYQQPHGMTPPEADSIKSLVKIAGIFGIIALIIGILVSLILFVIFPVLAMFGILVILLGYVFYSNCSKINDMIDRGQYQQAKSKTLIWMIIGLIFLNMIPGILLLVAYMKFDDLLKAGAGPGYMPPPPQYQEKRLCLSCGREIAVYYEHCPHCGKKVKQ